MKVSKEFKAGIIIVSTLLSFWYMFQFLKGKNLFRSDKIYYIILNEVSGLEKANVVSINGLKVGRIDKIEIVNIKSGKNIAFKVIVRIDKNFLIPTNSVAEIYEPGLMSGKEIRILLGNSENFLRNNQEISAKIRESLMSSLGNRIIPLNQKVTNTLGTIDETLLTTRIALGSANRIFDNENQQNIRLFLINLNKTILDFRLTIKKINKIFYSCNEIFKKFDKTINKIQELEIQKTLITLDESLNNLNKLLEKSNSNKGSLGKFINDTQFYDSLNSNLKNLNLLIKDFRKNPKRYIHFSIFGNKDRKNNFSEKKDYKNDTLLVSELENTIP